VATARWFFDLIYGSVPAEFESDFNVDESVRRLSAVTKSFAIFTSQAVAEGEVSKDVVSLRKAYPFFAVDLRGGFEPHFKGEFQETGDRVRLSGQFTLGSFTKAFATFWFGIVLLSIGITTPSSLLAGDPRTWWFPLAGAGLFALGVAGASFGKRWTHDDIRWLSSVIEEALCKNPSSPAGPR
jgi:hypothetical protein